MRFRKIIAGLLAGVVALASCLPPLAAQEPAGAGKEQWQPLFNGTDLAGWSDPMEENASSWQVANDGGGAVLIGSGGGRGQPAVLVSDRSFKNLRLRVVFRCTRPAGGMVELRRTGEGDVTSSYGVSTCVQPYWLVKSRPTGNVIKLRNYRYGYSGAPPDRESNRIPAGVNAWHTLDAFVTANRIQTWVNGQPADDFIDAKKPQQSGAITLVAWGDSSIQFREILIQKLPD